MVILDVLQDQVRLATSPVLFFFFFLFLSSFPELSFPMIIIAVQELNDPYGKDFALKQKILNESRPEPRGKLFSPGWPFALKFILLSPYTTYSLVKILWKQVVSPYALAVPTPLIS